MTFEEILTQVQELLQREGRVAYRILKRRFALNDDDLEDLKADLIDAKRLAVDEEGKVLVWVGTDSEGERGNGEEAEECFLKAIAIAQTQQAKSLELRAVMSLARLWQQQALEHGAGSKEQGARSQESGVRSQEQEAGTRLADAHKLLSDVYNWFTEGFDTKDLQEAKTLLDSLASSVQSQNGFNESINQ